MAKKKLSKKRKTKQVKKSVSKRKIITARDQTRFRILTKAERPKRVKYGSARGRQQVVRKYFRETIKPRFKKFVERTKGSRRLYLFNIRHSKKVRGLKKKISGGFSAKRARIRNEKDFERFMDRYEEALIGSLEKYLKRKDVVSLNLYKIDMEVILETLRPVSTKRSKRKNAKRVRSRRRRI